MLNINSFSIEHINRKPSAIKPPKNSPTATSFRPSIKALNKVLATLSSEKESTITQITLKAGLDRTYVFKSLKVLKEEGKVNHVKRVGDSGVPETFITLAEA